MRYVHTDKEWIYWLKDMANRSRLTRMAMRTGQRRDIISEVRIRVRAGPPHTLIIGRLDLFDWVGYL